MFDVRTAVFVIRTAETNGIKKEKIMLKIQFFLNEPNGKP